MSSFGQETNGAPRVPVSICVTIERSRGLFVLGEGMQAKIKKENSAFIIHLSGKVDFDSSEPFRKTILNHLNDSDVVFNMRDLDFVGSNGITPFIDTLKTLCQGTRGRVRFCYLSSEFVRLFEASDIPFGVNFQDEVTALHSLFQSPRFQVAQIDPLYGSEFTSPPEVQSAIAVDPGFLGEDKTSDLARFSSNKLPSEPQS